MNCVLLELLSDDLEEFFLKKQGLLRIKDAVSVVLESVGMKIARITCGNL